MRIVAMGALAFVLSAGLVPVARRVAIRKGITDDPKHNKWHTTPTPYFGGIAIAVAAMLAAVFAHGWEAQTIALLVGATALGVVGLVDDVRTVHPVSRLIIEAMVASAVFFAGARVHLVNGPVDFVLTVVWLVIITNSFNLLDNVDGAMGSIGTTIAVALTIACVLEGQWFVGALGAVVAGACLGFLIHNWHPAKIFMGDAGSLFLGFLLAAIGLKLRTIADPASSVVAVMLLVGPALFDTSLVVISRVRARRPFYLGGTDHTSHRLLRLGLGHNVADVILVAATAYSAGLGVLVARKVMPALPAAAMALMPAIVGLILLLRVVVYEDGQELRVEA